MCITIIEMLSECPFIASLPLHLCCLIVHAKVQRKVLKEKETKEGLHSDTAFSAGSLKAARRAAGAVQHAVDW